MVISLKLMIRAFRLEECDLHTFAEDHYNMYTEGRRDPLIDSERRFLIFLTIYFGR